MKRLIEDYLKYWKKSINRKPLIVRGARQVGKTYTIKQFGKNNFKHFIAVNLELNDELKLIFRKKNPQSIIDELSIIYDTPIVAGKTLLFIDEIQIVPEAIAVLRYFYEQMPELHVVAAGSLLDHSLNEMQYSMPVGRVEFAYMYPLNFKEFLAAQSENGLLKYIDNFSLKNTFSELIHNKIAEYLRLYFFIGGMPEAVMIYAKTKNLIEVEKVHASILSTLQYDFAKYGTRKEQDYLKESLHYVANNIGKKVKYVNINRRVHSSHLKTALLKLELSRIIHLIRKTKSSKVPITQYVDNEVFKPLFLDIGLANHQAQIKLTDIHNLTTDFEGALAEQFIGQEFLASFPVYIDSKLYYWAREAKNSNAEIDYLFQIGNHIYPIEVKAGKTGTLKSLQVYLSEKKQTSGIRFNMSLPTCGANLRAKVNVKGKQTDLLYKLVSLPLYLAGRINQIIAAK